MATIVSCDPTQKIEGIQLGKEFWMVCVSVFHFKSIRVAIFYAGLPKPNATLLLYPGLGPAVLRRLRRESLPVSIGGVYELITSIFFFSIHVLANLDLVRSLDRLIVVFLKGKQQDRSPAFVDIWVNHIFSYYYILVLCNCNPILSIVLLDCHYFFI